MSKTIRNERTKGYLDKLQMNDAQESALDV